VGKFFLGLFVILLLLTGGVYYVGRTTGNDFGLGGIILKKGTINFSTQAFGNGNPIPLDYTCDGKDVSPVLLIDRVPGDAKSLAIIVDDPSATPATFTHFMMFNIDPGVESIGTGEVPEGAIVANNDYGKNEYNGPCPPVGVHKYYFRIYALDTALYLDENAKRSNLDKAMKGHIIARGEFYGEYAKNN
jgi:Raf kinase inhibitor-like YbhB/YbcL family protein